MKKLFPLMILMMAGIGFGQTDLPEMGSIKDLAGKTKVYIACDAANEKWLLKEFNRQHTLVRVDKPDDAEFIIEFTTVHRGTQANLSWEEGEMNVYFLRDKKKVIAWRDSAKTGWGTPSTQLIKRFLKATDKSKQ